MLNFEKLYQEAHQDALNHTIETNGENTNVFPCGFAWINIKPANSAFSKWLLEKGHARKDSYLKGITIWVGQFDQSYYHKTSYAYRLANNFIAHGIKAVPNSRMD